MLQTNFLAYCLIVTVVLTSPELKPLQWSPNWQLQAVEQENQKLEEEILRIQLARGRQHNYEGWRVSQRELN